MQGNFTGLGVKFPPQGQPCCPFVFVDTNATVQRERYVHTLHKI